MRFRNLDIMLFAGFSGAFNWRWWERKGNGNLEIYLFCVISRREAK